MISRSFIFETSLNLGKLYINAKHFSSKSRGLLPLKSSPSGLDQALKFWIVQKLRIFSNNFQRWISVWGESWASKDDQRQNYGDPMAGYPEITLESRGSSLGHTPPPLATKSSNDDLGVRVSVDDWATIGQCMSMVDNRRSWNDDLSWRRKRKRERRRERGRTR